MRKFWIASVLFGSIAGCSHRTAAPSQASAETPFEEADRLHRVGLAHARNGDLDAARAAWRRGLELNPRHASLCASLGMLELESGDAMAAVPLLERASRLRPTPTNLRNAAHALAAAGPAWRAAAAFDELFGVDEPTLRDALWMVELGLAEPDAFADPLVWAKRAVQIDPASLEAHLALGRVLAMRGAPRAEVDAAFERARELAPRDAVVEISWASALEQIGEHDAGIEQIAEAIGRLPHVPALHAQRVAMLVKAGRCPEAVTELEQLRARFPREAAPLQATVDHCRSKAHPMHRDRDPSDIDDKQLSRALR